MRHLPINQLEHLLEKMKQTPSALYLESLFFPRPHRDQHPHLLHQLIQDVEIHDSEQNQEAGGDRGADYGADVREGGEFGGDGGRCGGHDDRGYHDDAMVWQGQ